MPDKRWVIHFSAVVECPEDKLQDIQSDIRACVSSHKPEVKQVSVFDPEPDLTDADMPEDAE